MHLQKTGFGILRRVRFALAYRTGPFVSLYADLGAMSTDAVSNSVLSNVTLATLAWLANGVDDPFGQPHWQSNTSTPSHAG
jgi:hypothetical protein